MGWWPSGTDVQMCMPIMRCLECIGPRGPVETSSPACVMIRSRGKGTMMVRPDILFQCGDGGVVMVGCGVRRRGRKNRDSVFHGLYYRKCVVTTTRY